MTPLEFEELVSWIEDRWGVSDVWTNADRIYPDLAHLPKVACSEALWDYYRAGHAHAPRPSVLLAEATEAANRRAAEAEKVTARCEEHLWAHLDRAETVECVRCGLEEPHVPHDGGSCVRQPTLI